MPFVFAEYPNIAYQMTCHHGAVAPPRVKSLDLLLPLEPVVADCVEPLGHIELVSRLAAVFVDIGPIIGDQSIKRAPQRQIIAVQHPQHPPWTSRSSRRRRNPGAPL